MLYLYKFENKIHGDPTYYQIVTNQSMNGNSELPMRPYLVMLCLYKFDLTFFLENKMHGDLTYYQQE